MIPIISQQEAVKVIKSGGVVAVPTETAYGLAADATNEEAVSKIYQIKGRQEAKPILVLVNSLEMAVQYAEFSDKALELAQKYWPGPLTLVVPRHNQRNIEISKYRDGDNTSPPPSPIIGEGERFAPSINLIDTTIGIRWTSHALCQKLIKQLGKPITAPSANVSGLKTCYTVDEIQAQYQDRGLKPDGIVDGGVLQDGEVSTVVRVVAGEVNLIRQGSVMLSGFNI